MRAILEGIMLQAITRHLLSRPGYSQHRLARELGISQAALSRLAAGAGKETLASTAFKLIEAAGGRVVLPDGVLAAPGPDPQEPTNV